MAADSGSYLQSESLKAENFIQRINQLISSTYAATAVTVGGHKDTVIEAFMP